MPLIAATFPAWSVAPFVLLLLCIAMLPLFAERWWHRNRNKAIVAAAFGLPMAAWAAFVDPHALGHQAMEYTAFITLLGALFVMSGGVEVRGTLRGAPLGNTAILALGAVLANAVGTTGASMLLIRPFLRANRDRKHRVHQVVFFIFLVSNLGGLLTPLGDPPLYIGFLKGVPFTWTLQLWPQWAVAVGACLAVFFMVDRLFAGKEPPPAAVEARQPLSIAGGVNLFLLALGVGSVFAGGRWIAPLWGAAGGVAFQVAALTCLSAVSLAVTPATVRHANHFTWHPLVEVAVLFAGIFAAMIPALAVLRETHFGISEPWHFFWAAGSLSSFLDNAPTYAAFFVLAQGASTALPATPILAAVSCGSVMFGAMTYIGNGPNFMVKAIAEHFGVKMPSFFRYMAWSIPILVPVFVALTFLFFR